jgi:glucosamine--fructose-6-phosphate aminotransferase (isomerizing)
MNPFQEASTCFFLGFPLSPSFPDEMRKKQPYFMHEMIHDQPSSLSSTLELCKKEAQDVTAYWSDVNKFLLTGCGTSFHAALASSYMFHALFHKTEVQAIQSFELNHYYGTMNPRSLVIAFSHTGNTKATIDSLARAKESGALTLGVTGVKDSNIFSRAHRVLVVGDGKEQSRAHTKSYTSSLIAAYYLAAYFLRTQASHQTAELMLEQLSDIPQSVHAIISNEEKNIAKLAREFSSIQKYFFLGTGPNEATALEAGLKMKETNHTVAEGMELEQFLHGPWVSLNPDSLVFILAPMGPSHQRVMDLLRICKDLDVRTVAITNDKHVVELATHSIFVPDVSEELSPLAYIVPLQLFAYYASIERGLNPDMIRYDDDKYWRARNVIFPPGTH